MKTTLLQVSMVYDRDHGYYAADFKCLGCKQIHVQPIPVRWLYCPYCGSRFDVVYQKIEPKKYRTHWIDQHVLFKVQGYYQFFNDKPDGWNPHGGSGPMEDQHNHLKNWVLHGKHSMREAFTFKIISSVPLPLP